MEMLTLGTMWPWTRKVKVTSEGYNSSIEVIKEGKSIRSEEIWDFKSFVVITHVKLNYKGCIKCSHKDLDQANLQTNP